MFWDNKPKVYIPKPRQHVEFVPRALRQAAEQEDNVPKPNIETVVKKETVPKSKQPDNYIPEKEFMKTFKRLTNQYQPHNVWTDFIFMCACSLSNPVDKTHYDKREELYLGIIKKYSKQEQNLFPDLFAHTVMALEHNREQDFLGDIFMKLELGNSAKGQFFTPYHICDFMAKVAMQDVVSQVEKDGYISINDPCCGGGAMLIAGIHEARRQLEKAGLNWQNHVLIIAQDVDQTVALMCYIQLSLLGAAAFVKIGNSLTDPIRPNDNLDNYWYTPMYFSNTWTMRRILAALKKESEDG